MSNKKGDCPTRLGEFSLGREIEETEIGEKREEEKDAIKKLEKEVVKAAIKIEILFLFYRNEHTMDASRNIAKQVKMGDSLVEQVLEELTKIGILEKTGQGVNAIYTLTSNEDNKTKFEEMMERLEKEFGKK